MYDNLAQGIASLLLFFGIFYVGKHKLRGPALGAISELIFIGIGYIHGVWSLSLVGLVLLLMQSYNLFLWRREGLTW